MEEIMLKAPSFFVTFACLCLLGLGEIAGTLLGYGENVKAIVRPVIKAHPKGHGLMGVDDIDRTIVEKMASEVVARIDTFHLHGHGLGIVVFLISFVIANSAFSERQKEILTFFISLGLLYPFGWLTIAFALPALGHIEALKLAEYLFFIPFGGAFLLALWVLILLILWNLLSGKKTLWSSGLSLRIM